MTSLETSPDESAAEAALQRADWPMAEAIYQKILEKNPANISALVGLAHCFLPTGRKGEALQALRRAAALAPNSGALGHMVAALSGENAPPHAPPDYVAWVFDSAAGVFEQRLGALHYRGPAMCRELAADFCEKNAKKLAILDLGCGTGLLAAPFRRFARRLDGVDLSQGMLAEAGKKALYDDLFHMDAVAFLQASQRQRPDFRYDLILAADVLIYIGDPQALFAAARAIMSENSLFVLTTEYLENGENMRLNPTGRYSHSDACIHKAAGAAGLAVQAETAGPLRLEEGRPIPGKGYALTLNPPQFPKI